MSARDWDALLYALSAIVEVVGVLITIWDLSRGAVAIRKFLENEPPVQVVASDYAKLSDTAPKVGSGTTEQRLAALEQWQLGLPQELDTRFEHTRSELRLAMNAAYKTFMARWREVKGFVRSERRSRLRLYLGPLVVFAGIVLGLVANLVNIYALGTH